MVIIFATSCKTVKTDKDVDNKANQEIISVEYPESYELANIILALTEYGKADKWEVRKGFDYYEKMQDYFQSASNHPLLDSVNYSRERWKEYLSFRTDAYAFVFDENNRLKRHIDFYANEGVNPFDKHLDLINDFIQKTNFRTFFSQNQDYYKRVSAKYKKNTIHKRNEGFFNN